MFVKMSAKTLRRCGSVSAIAVMALAVSGLTPVLAVDTIKVDGSSTVYPITEAMAEEFQKKERGKIRVTVGIAGTGGGFKKFCRGETDISDASRPIKDSEKEACKASGVEYIELPIALDALTVVVNPKNTWVDHLTVDELKKVWEPEAQGKIVKWNQVRPGFPDQPLMLYGPGVDSGTYDYFTEAVVGKEHSSRGDFQASEDDNVLVQGVSSDVGALGFFGLAYYLENTKKLKAVPISWKGGAPVLPSIETAKDASYQPLSRPIFIYVNRKSADKPYVKKFVEYYVNPKTAPKLVKEVGYVPLPEDAYAKAQSIFGKREIGTVFHGSEVGIGIAELMARERKH